MDITITHDDTGTSVHLFDSFGDDDDDIDQVTFDDEAATAISAGPPPYGPGSFQPQPGSLSDFDGESLAGTWTLSLSDNLTVDSVNGIIQAWGIRGEKTEVSGVPESGSTLLLLGCGLLACLGLRRRLAFVQ